MSDKVQPVPLPKSSSVKFNKQLVAFIRPRRFYFYSLYYLVKPIVYSLMIIYGGIGLSFGFLFQIMDPSKITAANPATGLIDFHKLFNTPPISYFFNQFAPLELALFVIFVIAGASGFNQFIYLDLTTCQDGKLHHCPKHGPEHCGNGRLNRWWLLHVRHRKIERHNCIQLPAYEIIANSIQRFLKHNMAGIWEEFSLEQATSNTPDTSPSVKDSA